MGCNQANDLMASLFANVESSPVRDTSCLAELIQDLTNSQFLCGKCPKPVTIIYFQLVEGRFLQYDCVHQIEMCLV